MPTTIFNWTNCLWRAEIDIHSPRTGRIVLIVHKSVLLDGKATKEGVHNC